jgi:hypothetical protein
MKEMSSIINYPHSCVMSNIGCSKKVMTNFSWYFHLAYLDTRKFRFSDLTATERKKTYVEYVKNVLSSSDLLSNFEKISRRNSQL